MKKFKLALVVFLCVASYKFYFRNGTYDANDSMIKFEKIYSDDLRDSISEFINKKVAENLSPKELYKELKTNFHIVKTIETDLSSPTSYKFTIYGVEPKWVVNGNLILGDKKRLYPIENFTNFDVNTLGQVDVDEKYCSNKIADSVYQFLQNVPQEISNRYNITYEDKRNIVLHAINAERGKTILVDETSALDTKKLAYVDSIEGREKVFDLRFRDRIITRSHTRIRA